MGPGSQTGSDIIQSPPDRQTHVKTLPCPQTSFAWGKKTILRFAREQYPFYMCTVIGENPKGPQLLVIGGTHACADRVLTLLLNIEAATCLCVKL